MLFSLSTAALFLATMVQSNFIDNVRHDGAAPLQDAIIENVAIIADMATSPDLHYRYPSATEMDLGGGYTVKLAGDSKTLYKNGQAVDASTPAETVVSDLLAFRGGRRSGAIGSTLSNNYGIHMSADRAVQFYKREFDSVLSADDAGAANSTQQAAAAADKEKRAFRCTNKTVGAPKTCGNKVKSGDPVNSAHNCKGAGGKGYECTFPQGPTGNDFGVCCYSISTAVSCNFEGGYCFLDKVKNSCGNDCLT